jgi:hypothetical protein
MSSYLYCWNNLNILCHLHVGVPEPVPKNAVKNNPHVVTIVPAIKTAQEA